MESIILWSFSIEAFLLSKSIVRLEISVQRELICQVDLDESVFCVRGLSFCKDRTEKVKSQKALKYLVRKEALSEVIAFLMSL